MDKVLPVRSEQPPKHFGSATESRIGNPPGSMGDIKRRMSILEARAKSNATMIAKERISHHQAAESLKQFHPSQPQPLVKRESPVSPARRAGVGISIPNTHKRSRPRPNFFQVTNFLGDPEDKSDTNNYLKEEDEEKENNEASHAVKEEKNKEEEDDEDKDDEDDDDNKETPPRTRPKFEPSKVKKEAPEQEYGAALKVNENGRPRPDMKAEVKEEPTSDGDDMDLAEVDESDKYGKYNEKNARITEVKKRHESEDENEDDEDENEDEKEDDDDAVPGHEELRRRATHSTPERNQGAPISPQDRRTDTRRHSAKRKSRVIPVPFPPELEDKQQQQQQQRVKNEREALLPGTEGRVKPMGAFSKIQGRFTGTNGPRHPSPNSDSNVFTAAPPQKQQHQQLATGNPSQPLPQPQIQPQMQSQVQRQQQGLYPQMQTPQIQSMRMQHQQQQQQQYSSMKQRQQELQMQSQMQATMQPQTSQGFPGQQAFFTGMPQQNFYTGMPQQAFFPGMGMMMPPQTPGAAAVAEKGNALLEKIRKGHLRTIDKRSYLELAEIGRGASSRVSKVLGDDFKLYALKRISFKDIGQEQGTALNGVRKEIGLMEKLRGNSLVIQLIGYEFHRNSVYIVMELGETDLAKLLQASRGREIDMNVIRVYWQQMLRSVNAVHEENIIHADLKPQNFVLVNGTWKLIDFGISMQMRQDSTHVTMGVGVGTPNYLSPEVLNHGVITGDTVRVTKKADTWSLGCILYQMVFGSTPFQGFADMKKYNAIVDPKYTIPIPPDSYPEELKARLPASLKNVLSSCFQRDPKKRPTIKQLLNHPFLTGETFCPHCPHCTASGGAHDSDTDDDDDDDDDDD